MKVIKPSFQIEEGINGEEMIQKIERRGRICYKSEDKITPDSARAFITGIINRGHESVLEHEKVTVVVICDRGVSHEIVRHRIGAFSQESTRYCNYNSEGKEVTFIKPLFFEDENKLNFARWKKVMETTEHEYKMLVSEGASPQEARSVLPNSLKTEIAITFDLREWRHFFRLRCAKAAHPQMREITIPMLLEFKKLIPVVFDDIPYDK
jgi:thymidylate synthase (FAD)